MRTFLTSLVVVVLAVLAVTFWRSASGPGTPVPDEEFYRAVHYFSDDWPKTFWEDFENSQVRRELEQIRNDGFDTVILVLPWRGFDIGFEDGSPTPGVLYDRLAFLLDEIETAGLGFGLRVGFPHHFDSATGINIWPLCRAVYTDPEVRGQWVAYLQRIAEIVEPHRSAFRFAFFSWEDFFCPYSVMPGLSREERLEIARMSGYQHWLSETQPPELVSFLYSESFGSMEAVPVPERDSPSFWLFIQFIDRFLVDELVLPGREVLPELSMEVRVDKDGVRMNDTYNWVGHDLMLDDPAMRGSYWGPYHGAQNTGEILDADTALRNLEHMLKRVSDDGRNRRHVLEQFNFVDNTPHFVGHHARIDPDQLPEFLEGSAPLLKQYSSGYGLWAYRDYPDTALYNGSFELGLRDWETSGGVTVATNDDGDQALDLAPGAAISQQFTPYDRFAALGLAESLTFCAHYVLPAGPARIELMVNGNPLGAFEVSTGGRQCQSLDVAGIQELSVRFTLTSDEAVRVDDMQLFAFEQKLGVYRRDGSPDFARDSVIRMNREWLPGGGADP